MQKLYRLLVLDASVEGPPRDQEFYINTHPAHLETVMIAGETWLAKFPRDVVMAVEA